MKKALSAAALVAMLTAGGLWIGIDGKPGLDQAAGCPDEIPEGVTHMRQMPNGRCLLLDANRERLRDPDEAAPKTLMWACPDTDEQPGGIACQPPGPPPRPGCRVIPGSQSDYCGISMANVDLGYLDALREFCAPCPVTAGSWGPCPQCGLDKDCAERCPVSVDISP